MSSPDSGGGSFSDLLPRLLSGLGLAFLGALVVIQGGILLILVVALTVGIMVWELARICGSGEPHLLAISAGVSCLFVLLLPQGFGVPFLMMPAFLGVSRLQGFKVVYAVFTVLILLAGFGLVHIRADFGPGWMAWLMLVVIATDVAGYFAGRVFGGPKFWPRLSPKKTWSGTVAGWVAAACVGAIAFWVNGGGPEIIGLSVGLSMASQLGDVSESALKRRTGVKDSSGLLPGHGGLLDRFDGFLGATVVFLMLERAVGFPPVPFGG